jgi:5'-phosphate synthase pdxT subunit
VKVGVLALQGAARPHAEVVRVLGACPVEVRTPDDLEPLDALILPGGESTSIWLLLESAGLADPLAERLSSGLPVLGTCAGMILLGTEIQGGRSDQRCFGAIDVVVQRNAFGRQVDSFEADLDVAGLSGGRFRAVFIRAPVVEKVGEGVEVLAAVDGRPVLCRQGAVMVASFHPELSGDLRLHHLFLHQIAA